MKLRPILVLILFVVSAGVLVWFYYAAARPSRKPEAATWSATIADLDACCRRKHVLARQYDRFADIAASEDRRSTEQLFRAMAFSERLQELNCSAAIRRLGGTYTPPERIVLFGGTTDSNLERSADNERLHFGPDRNAEIRQALDRGNRYAARMLIWASAADRRNIALIDRCRRAANDTERCRYAVCPVCGNLYAAEHEDLYCPFCLTDGQRFVRFE